MKTLENKKIESIKPQFANFTAKPHINSTVIIIIYYRRVHNTE